MFLSLKQVVFKEIHMEVDIRENKELELENKFSFDVNYNNDNSLCIAHLRQEVASKNNTKEFNIIVDALGNFICEGIETEVDKKGAHIQSYLLLFPYVQNMIAQLANHAGLPPFMIDMAKMRIEDVILESKQ